MYNTDKILSQNSKRLKKHFKNINPVFGDTDDPDRFPFFINGMKKAFLPLAMKNIPVISYLLKAKSISKFIRSDFFRNNFISVADLFTHINMLRLKYDFLFWIHHNFPESLHFKHVILLIRTLQKLKNDQKPIYLLIRKNENQDISEIIRWFFLWHKSFSKPNLNVLTVSPSLSSSIEHKESYLGYNNLNNPVVKFSKTEITSAIFSSSFKAKFWFFPASSPDKCRALNFAFIYLSDMGNWPDSNNENSTKVINATFPVILNSPDNGIIIDSGPSKRNSSFSIELQAAKNGLSPFKYLYIPWFHNPDNILKFDLPEEKIKLIHLIREYRSSNSFPRFKNVSGKYLFSLWNRGVSLEAINWYLAESTFYRYKSQYFNRYPPV